MILDGAAGGRSDGTRKLVVQITRALTTARQPLTPATATLLITTAWRPIGRIAMNYTLCACSAMRSGIQCIRHGPALLGCSICINSCTDYFLTRLSHLAGC